jgi:uncharacterized repeat protein (TIGR01451 family)
MAAPHVAGLAALLISARPELSGQVGYLRQVIEQSSKPNIGIPFYAQPVCGGISYTTIPNNHFGWGRIQAVQAIDAALVQVVKQAPTTANFGELITYTLSVTNLHPSNILQNLELRDTLPAGAQFVRASEPYTRIGDVLFWNWPTLNPAESQQAWITVKLLSNAGVVINQDYGWRSDEFGEILGPPVQTAIQYLWRYIFPIIFKEWVP